MVIPRNCAPALASQLRAPTAVGRPSCNPRDLGLVLRRSARLVWDSSPVGPRHCGPTAPSIWGSAPNVVSWSYRPVGLPSRPSIGLQSLGLIDLRCCAPMGPYEHGPTVSWDYDAMRLRHCDITAPQDQPIMGLQTHGPVMLQPGSFTTLQDSRPTVRKSSHPTGLTSHSPAVLQFRRPTTSRLCGPLGLASASTIDL